MDENHIFHSYEEIVIVFLLLLLKHIESVNGHAILEIIGQQTEPVEGEKTMKFH